jgi:ligand-binding sensor domain-containing protein
MIGLPGLGILFMCLRQQIRFKLLFFSIFLSLICLGQEPVLKNFSVKDGLPSSEVYNIMQDSKGYLWFCTDGGVSRYDGNSFRNFSSRNGLKDNTVFGSLEDHKGRIWFRTLSGKLFYFLGDSIYSIPANERLTDQIHNGLITSFYVDKGDTIWCGTSGGRGYFKIAPPYRGIDFSFIPLERFYNLMELDETGYIWNVIGPSKLYELVPKYFTNTVTQYYRRTSKSGAFVNKQAPFALNSSTRYLKSRTGDYFISGRNELVSDRTNDHILMDKNWIISLYEDRNGDLWAGQSNMGVTIFPGGNLQVGKKLKILNNCSVSSILEDQEGGFWFCTLEKGVFYMPTRDLLFYDKNDLLTDDKILSLVPLGDKGVFAGMKNGDICAVTVDTVIVYKSPPDFKADNIITSLTRGPVKDQIIVGGSHAFSFNQNTPGKREYFYDQILLKKFAGLDESRGISSFKSFAVDSKGNLWGGNYLSLSEMDPVKNTVKISYKPNSRVLSIACGRGDTLLLGCVNGLWSFKDGLFHYLGNRDPAFTVRIEDIAMDKDSCWWFATKGEGVILKKKNRIFHITEQEGLSSNICRSVYPDQSGMVWVSTNRGISRIRMKEGGGYSIDVYSTNEGLLTNEINQIVRTGDIVWAATNQGLIRLDANKLFSNLAPPPVYLTSLEINSSPRLLQDSIFLRHSENYLHMGFIGISYMRSSKLRYKYRLEGLDTAWTYTSQNTIQYTTLPPGKYTFQVYAMNSSGVSSLKPARLYFVISKPFWKEWWFILSVSTLILTLAITWINSRINKLRRIAVETSDINRKMAELKLVALRSQMNPHFIFNCINSIQLFILKNDSESAHKHLTRFSKLMRQVLENSKHEFITLDKELHALELYIELERMRFSYKFNFKISIAEDVHPDNLLISPLVMQPYVENAIWHGMMHLEEKEGELLIRLEKKDGSLKCIIDDNGIGRKKAATIRKNSSHKSTALSINKERVDIINNLHESKLTVVFVDKADADGNSSGTRVEISLPYLEEIIKD